MSEARAFAYRERATAHRRRDGRRRPRGNAGAWLIVERDWTRMAEREAVKLDDGVSRLHWVDNAARSSNAWRELEGAVRKRAEPPGGHPARVGRRRRPSMSEALGVTPGCHAKIVGESWS